MNISQGYFSPINNKCAKRVVTAILIPKDNKYPPHYIARNSCLNAQEVCPREEVEDYTKCKTVCKQLDHAEVAVLKKAGKRAKNSTVILIGHNHCCDDCLKAMGDAEVAEVIIPEN